MKLHLHFTVIFLSLGPSGSWPGASRSKSTRSHRPVWLIPLRSVTRFPKSVHNFTDTRSEVVTGGLGEPARRLLPLQPESWAGGRVAFTLNIDPAKTNYATIKLWGSDVMRNLLILFCEGKQIGYRHLGDIDILDIGSGAPAFNDCFFYNTTPLPLEMTRGKTNLNFEIRCVGPTWGYGNTFERYQKTMTEPKRGIYSFGNGGPRYPVEMHSRMRARSCPWQRFRQASSSSRAIKRLCGQRTALHNCTTVII